MEPNLLNIISNTPNVIRTNPLQNNGFFHYFSIVILSKFNDLFTLITSLPKQNFRTSKVETLRSDFCVQ